MIKFLLGFVVGGLFGYAVACFMFLRQLDEADCEKYGDRHDR